MCKLYLWILWAYFFSDFYNFFRVTLQACRQHMHTVQNVCVIIGHNSILVNSPLGFLNKRGGAEWKGRLEQADLTHLRIVRFAAFSPFLFLLNLRFHICQFLRAVICLGGLGEESKCLTPLQLRNLGVSEKCFNWFVPTDAGMSMWCHQNAPASSQSDGGCWQGHPVGVANAGRSVLCCRCSDSKPLRRPRVPFLHLKSSLSLILH